MTAQQYRHFALYFEGSAALIGTEEYDTKDEMLAVMDEWLGEYRDDHAVRVLEIDAARTSLQVQVYAALTIEIDRGLQDVVICSIPVVQTRNSVIVSDVNGSTEHGPFDVDMLFHVHGSVIHTGADSLADEKFNKVVAAHGAKLVQVRSLNNGFTGALGFTKREARIGSGKNRVVIELVTVPPNKASALAPKFVTI